ncbi:MAG: putative lipoprotein [Firmicutes bacterium]|nr:putative lipoprotein [Bacillota bacterium]
MKKLISILVGTLMLLSLAGCGAAKPEATVEKFFAAAQKLDAEKMASTLVPSNTEDIKDIKSMLSTEQVPEEQVVLYEYLSEYLKSNAGKMTFKVTGSEINGDNAVITVDCKYVDAGPVFKATMGALMQKMLSLAFSGAEIAEEQTSQMFVDTMREQANSMSETFKETTVKVNCIKQDDIWYISETTDEMLDVVTSGFVTAAKDMGGIFEGAN